MEKQLKRCPRCNTSKELSEFAKDRSTKSGLEWICRTCKSGKNRDYKRSPAGHAAQSRARQKEREVHLALVDFVEAVKTREGCQVCGESEPVCLHYHHLDSSQKKRNLSRVLWMSNWKEEEIKEEMRKCAILCANCHAKVHHKKIDGATLKPIKVE